MTKKLLFGFFLFLSSAAFAQSANPSLGPGRVNLEDVKIKGEANGNGLGFSNRNRYSLDDRVKIRRNFRPEVMENLPEYFKNPDSR